MMDQRFELCPCIVLYTLYLYVHNCIYCACTLCSFPCVVLVKTPSWGPTLQPMYPHLFFFKCVFPIPEAHVSLLPDVPDDLALVRVLGIHVGLELGRTTPVRLPHQPNHFSWKCRWKPEKHIKERGDLARLPAKLARRRGQMNWNCVRWEKKLLGRLKRPRQDKSLLYRHNEPNRLTKEGPLHMYSPHLPKFQQSGGATQWWANTLT